jgi:hypothetical protein
MTRSSEPSLATIRQRLAQALHRLYNSDADLIALDVNERSLTHRLAVHLTALFPEWDVDCEYNRDGAEPKRTDEVEDRLREHGEGEGSSRDTRGRTVYPDIIVHRRNTHTNLLVVEVKKSSSRIPDKLDRLKVDALCKMKRYRYRYGFLIRLAVGDGAIVPNPEMVFPKR